MSGILGILCLDDIQLNKIASQRKKVFIERSVANSEVVEFEKGGWEVLRKNKRTTRLKKPKAPDIIFEDRVWMIFYRLGFKSMNSDRNCKLKFNGYTKQIDVLAKDENNIFIIECRTSKTQDPINVRVALEELVGKRKEIQEAIYSHWGTHCGRINLGVLISSREKRPEDQDYVEGKKEANLFLWSKKDIEYIENLIDQIGYLAKFQLYSVIFGGKKQHSLRKEYLALRCKLGGKTCYSFLMSAKELLSYAYVHHRRLTDIVEASQAYQRMLNSKKLMEVAKFIDREEGFFPNSIIINFSEHLNWNKKESQGDIAVGMLTLPEYYGCAWIIDGQHRLYGAALAEKDILVPILAFEAIEQKDQANLFVEINEKQKKVPRDLLWDLYSDIYRDSPDDKQKLLRQIAETAKKLDESVPLRGIIDIPSSLKERPVKLSFTTVCSTIEKYSPWDSIKHPTNEEKTPENAARIISSFFMVLQQLWPEDWQKGNEGVLLTNNGFGVFMMLFQDIINHIVYKQKDYLLQANRKKEFEGLLKNSYLKPTIEYLKTNADLQKSIRRGTGRGPQNDNAAYIDLKIRDFVPDYYPARTSNILPPSATEKPSAIPIIEGKAVRAEQILRDFVLDKLKKFYGSDNWWRQGLPGQKKADADRKWLAEVSRKPHLKDQKPNERKFEYFDLDDILDIIFYGQNWNNIFEPHFYKKENLQRRIQDIKVLRNPVAHQRKLDDQDMIDGLGGLFWLSNCLARPELNPYA